ncbi:MAG: hypothetical protein J0L69_01335 [Bacteroidetes bacterium]|nr:hypothetical protein [Bacteroidota bacterium]
MKKSISPWLVFLSLFIGLNLSAQPFPSEDEKIQHFTVFSKGGKPSFGDDDNATIYFFVIPEKSNDPFYIRVFDPDIGGTIDEKVAAFNSKTKYSFYGGKGAHSDKDAQSDSPKGNYKSGVFITGKTFGEDPTTDGNWYSFGPFNPKEGELQTENGGYVFKVVIEGLEGDDGNLFKMYLSSQKDKNVKVEGGNAFCYEYTFRLAEDMTSVCHIYPFIPPDVTSCEVSVFDYDDAGIVRVVSVAKKGDMSGSSTEGTWSQIKFPITTEELNTSLDIQFINKRAVKNNNVAVTIKNQYGKLLAFYATPIGGVPKFKYKIGVKPAK